MDTSVNHGQGLRLLLKWALSLSALLFFGLPVQALAQAKKAPFTMGNYKVVNTLRVSRLEFEFTIQADITNLGADAPKVVSTVTSTSPDTVIVVRTLTFGDVPAGATKTSLSTFAIRQNRLVAFDPSVLRWQYTVNSQDFKVAITSPVDGMLANTSVVHVTGTTSSSAASVNVNLTPATVSGNSFSADVPLTEGANTLTAVATNPLGLVATTSVNVSRDTEKPRVGINAPLENSVTTQNHVTVTGIFSDTVIGTVNSEQGTVIVNGVPAVVANRTFFANAVPLTPGVNTITVTGTDRAGNVGTATTTVTYEAGVIPRIQTFSGDNQSAIIGAPLAQPLVVLVTNDQGAPVPNTEVIFKVTQNDGEVTGGGRTARSVIVNTDAAGKAQASFQLGTRVGVGNNEVQATSVGFQGPAVFIASSTPAPAGLIVLDSGNRQAGVPNQSLPKPFVAIVVDAGYNRLANTPVIFTVIKGNGSLGGLAVKTVMTDSDGRALVTLTMGPDEGVENNVVEATFPGSARSPIAFLASGVLPGDVMQTSISGVVLDNSDVPVPGATITVVGTGLSAQSDAQGQFMLKPAPVGTVRLVVDGTTVLRPGSWVTLDYTLTTVAGHDNTLGMPVRLLQIDTSTAVGVGLNYGGTIVLPEYPGFSLTLAPGSVTFPGGSKVGSVTATVVHLDKTPEVPNFGQQPRFIISINPKQCLFNPPARLCLPNVDGLQPGQKTEMYSFDTDLASFVAIGTGTVSSDGTQICSDPGVGVIKGGWHCGGNPSVAGNAGTCPPCQKCEGSGCVTDASQTGACDDKDPCTVNDRCQNGTCKGDKIEITKVVAKAEGETEWVTAKDTDVHFTVEVTQKNCPGLEYEWDFGDGTKSNTQSATHKYTTTGDRTVKVTVKCTACPNAKMEGSVKVGVAEVTFARAASEDAAAGNAYGYDNMDTAPDTKDDYVSVKNTGYTHIKVKVEGTTLFDKVLMVPSDEAALKLEPEKASGAEFNLKVSGLADNAEKQIEARGGKKDGAKLGTINGNSYKELRVAKVSYYRILDSTVAGTTPAKNPTLPELKTAMNKIYKQAVVQVVDVDGSVSKDIRFDLNNNGYLDWYFDEADGGPELKAIKDAGLTGEPKIAYIEKVRKNFRLSAASAAGSDKITVNNIGNLTVGRSYTVGSATGAGVNITVQSIDAGTKTITLTAPLAAALPATSTIHYGLAGLSTDPQLVTDADNELIVTIVHEMMHRAVFGNLSDVSERNNTMYWTTGGTGDAFLRYKEQTSVDTGNGVPNGGTENQWKKIPR